MLDWLGNVVSNGWDSEFPILVSILCDIPEAMLIGMAKIVIRSHLILICLSFQAFARPPLISLNSDSKDSVLWELLLPKIHPFSQFILLFVKIVLKITLDKDSFWHGLVMSLRFQDLLDLLVNGILFHFSKPVIGGINRPVVGPNLLLSRIIVLVRFQVHLPDLFSFRHILS